LNGKVFGLGISMGPVTFYHLLEDRIGDAFPLPVRMPNEFKMPCRDWNGSPVIVPVRALDPQYQPQRIDHKSRKDLRDYFFKEFEANGLLTAGKVCEAQAWFIESKPFLEHLETLMKQGITIYSCPADLAEHHINQA
jgi:aminoglycoside N3'-acetyltransferase